MELVRMLLNTISQPGEYAKESKPLSDLPSPFLCNPLLEPLWPKKDVVSYPVFVAKGDNNCPEALAEGSRRPSVSYLDEILHCVQDKFCRETSFCNRIYL